jgi:integrase
MSITKLTAGDGNPHSPKKGTTWCVRAKRKDRSIGHEHFAENEYRKAVAYEKKVRAEECKPGAPAKSDAEKETFEEYAERWRSRQVSKDPVSIASALKRAYPIIGSDLIPEVDRERLEELQSTLFAHPYAYNTVELTMTYVKTVMRAAVDKGLIPKDPTVRLRMPRRDSLDDNGVVTEEQVPTHTEVLAMLESAPLRWRYAIALGFGLGPRVGEVLGVTPAQVNFFAGTLAIDAQEQRRGRVGPKSKTRTIQMPERVSEELRRAIKVHKWGDLCPLSTGPRGAVARRDEFYKLAWKPTLRGAGFAENRFKFHSARHYAASAMLARGVPVIEVAYVLGDTIETVSRVYAHWLRDAPSMAKGALDQALAPLPQGPRPMSRPGE